MIRMALLDDNIFLLATEQGWWSLSGDRGSIADSCARRQDESVEIVWGAATRARVSAREEDVGPTILGHLDFVRRHFVELSMDKNVSPGRGSYGCCVSVWANCF